MSADLSDSEVSEYDRYYAELEKWRKEGKDPAKWPMDAGEFYVCRWCGYHPGNRASWCALGCGSDYNHMFKVKP